MRENHGFPALFNKDSRVLILGSFPSVKSREVSFYYGHPQNRFWKMLALIFDEPIPVTKEEKISFCFRHQIALYDAVESCYVTNSSDASIKGVKPTNLKPILDGACIQKILLNGNTAARYYFQFQKTYQSIEVITLPSTSAANARFSLGDLVKEWGKHLS